MTKEEIISKLETLGWKRHGNNDEHYWKDKSNRYVSFDGIHIDCHVYNNGKHFPTYLYLEELNLFTNLFNMLTKEQKKMKYIRTKDGIYERQEKAKALAKYMPLNVDYIKYNDGIMIAYNVVKQADTIEELCDEFVYVSNKNGHTFIADFQIKVYLDFNGIIYGAIWTDKGLIYVAKMNDKGELELI